MEATVGTAILFTGHMIDKPGRPEPRFPPDLEPLAAARIARVVEPYAKKEMGAVMGFASCAQGGDILFHEQCRAVQIPTTIVIPFPPEVFIQKSVIGIPGSDWERRFWQLWTKTAEKQREALDLPQSDSAYGTCNIRLLERAQEYGAVHLIALWDGQRGEGPGGTADLVVRAGTGSKSDIISPASLKDR